MSLASTLSPQPRQPLPMHQPQSQQQQQPTIAHTAGAPAASPPSPFPFMSHSSAGSVVHQPMALYHHSINAANRLNQPQQFNNSNNVSVASPTPNTASNSGSNANGQQWNAYLSNGVTVALPISPAHLPPISHTLSGLAGLPHSVSEALSNTEISKRRKASEKSHRKVACTFCHTAKTVCVGGRPCDRCVRLHKSELCVDRVTTNKRSKKDESGIGGAASGDSGGNGGEWNTGKSIDGLPQLAPLTTDGTDVDENGRPYTQSAATGADSPIGVDAWSSIPDLVHSSFFQCLLVPQRAFPVVKPEDTIKTLLYVLAYLQDSLTQKQFIRAIKEMGYSVVSDTNTGTSNGEHVVVSKSEPSPQLQFGTDCTSTGAVDDDAFEPDSDHKVLYHSSYAHLPDITLPMQFSFNWNASPVFALHENTVATIFPTLIIERGSPSLPETAINSITLPSLSNTHRYHLNSMDLPLSVQVNDKFEYLFSWTQSEVKLLFSRHGRRALEKLSIGQLSPALSTLRDLLDGRVEVAHSVSIRNKYGNEIAAVEHKRVVMDATGWFERIVFTWMPMTQRSGQLGGG